MFVVQQRADHACHCLVNFKSGCAQTRATSAPGSAPTPVASVPNVSPCLGCFDNLCNLDNGAY